MTILINTEKMLLAVFISGFFLLLTVLFGIGKFGLPAVICAAFFGLYAVLAVLNGKTVHVSSEGIETKLFGIPLRSMNWSQVKEMGIVGLRVLHRDSAKRTGEKYLYFSPRAMTDDERFDLCLKWPPKDIIYFRYRAKYMEHVMQCCDRDLVFYNTGNFQP